MKKKDIADSGAQYAGTQPIQHAEVVLGQPAPEPAKQEQKPKPGPVNKTEKRAVDTPHKVENPRNRKPRSKPIL